VSDWTPRIIDGGLLLKDPDRDPDPRILQELRRATFDLMNRFLREHTELSQWDVVQTVGVVFAEGMVYVFEDLKTEQGYDAKRFGHMMERLFDGWMNRNQDAFK
jgi:hypothetical protein